MKRRGQGDLAQPNPHKPLPEPVKPKKAQSKHLQGRLGKLPIPKKEPFENWYQMVCDSWDDLASPDDDHPITLEEFLDILRKHLQ